MFAFLLSMLWLIIPSVPLLVCVFFVIANGGFVGIEEKIKEEEKKENK